MGSFSSYSSKIKRRFAFSASANAESALVSTSLGLVLVSAHDVHNLLIGSFSTNQLHSARCRLAHSWYLSPSMNPGCAPSSPVAMTSSAMSSSENPNELWQDRHNE